MKLHPLVSKHLNDEIFTNNSKDAQLLSILYSISHEVNQLAIENDSLALLRSALNASEDGILVVSTDKKVLFANEASRTIFKNHELDEANYTQYETQLKTQDFTHLEEVIGQTIKNGSDFLEQLQITKKYPLAPTLCTIYLKNGKVTEALSRPILTDNVSIGRLWIFRDITESRYNKKSSSYYSFHDVLTDLPNRSLFLEKVDNALELYKKDHTPVSLLYIDLDSFKYINDNYGHEVGDLVLQQFSKTLLNVVGNKGVVARQSGDEFLALLNNYYDNNEVNEIAQHILDISQKPFVVNNITINLTLSIGISQASDTTENASSLLRHADLAMYQAKQSTRNCFIFFEQAMEDQSKKDLIKQNELHRALQKGGFELYFQPKINVTNRNIVGAEALLRWKKEDGTLISAAEFIEIAEQTGLIIPISEWVFETAVKQLAQWQNVVPKDFVLSINVSAQHFAYSDIDTRLAKLVNQHGVSAQQIELEITENVLINQPKKSINKMQKLRELGFGLSIDDFGKGFSSLQYLVILPVNKIKLDRSFVLNLETNFKEQSVVKYMTELAHTFEFKIVIEGIESDESHTIIHELGCDLAQGYLYGKPMSKDNFIEHLQLTK